MGEVDITYGGFGVTNWDGTPFPPNHQFAFPAKPGLISQDMHMVDLRLEFPIAGQLSAVAGRRQVNEREVTGALRPAA